MRIRILNTDYELSKEGKKPVAVDFIVDEYKNNFKIESSLELRLDDKEVLTVKNNRIIEIRKNKEYGYDPLALTTQDIPDLEVVISHWKETSKHFIQYTSHGSSFRGHISSSYIFPDGTKKKYKAKEIPQEFEITIGEPFDTAFTSEECKYIASYPYRQHYKVGRLDYYLEKESVSIESPETIQYLDRNKPELVLEFLKFINLNPKEALYLLTKR